MTDPATIRPVPFAVRVFALLTVFASAALLVLGAQVTTLGAGMSDRGWPTSPTFLADNPQVLRGTNIGLKVEHSHRAVGFFTGACAAVLAVLAWWTDPGRGRRWFGLAATVVLLALYGQFHREMRTAWDARETARSAGQGVAAVLWPAATGEACAAAAVVLVAAGVATLRAGDAGRWVRLLASVALVAVMAQGLLGGFRVFLDQLMGTELAAVHGTFGQLVFCLLVAVAVRTAARRPGDELSDADRARLGRIAVALPAAVFVQLVWGAWLRHVGSPVAQRLHVMTAFAVTGLAVWVAARAVATDDRRRHLGFLAYHLLLIVAVQVMLGVEAWMGKFAAAGPQAKVLPTARTVTTGAAYVRTAHVLIGTALLASAVVFAMRVWRRPVGATGVEPIGDGEARRTVVAEPAAAT